MCKTRSDKWAEKVTYLLNFVSDLPAADAMYHNICSINFRTGKDLPLTFMGVDDDDSCTREKRGRRKNQSQEDAFLRVMTELEHNDEEQTTVNELIERMQKYVNDSGSVPYSFTCMKEKIKNHFGSEILITEINGKSNVITFISTAASILY